MSDKAAAAKKKLDDVLLKKRAALVAAKKKADDEVMLRGNKCLQSCAPAFKEMDEKTARNRKALAWNEANRAKYKKLLDAKHEMYGKSTWSWCVQTPKSLNSRDDNIFMAVPGKAGSTVKQRRWNDSSFQGAQLANTTALEVALKTEKERNMRNHMLFECYKRFNDKYKTSHTQADFHLVMDDPGIWAGVPRCTHRCSSRGTCHYMRCIRNPDVVAREAKELAGLRAEMERRKEQEVHANFTCACCVQTAKVVAGASNVKIDSNRLRNDCALEAGKVTEGKETLQPAAQQASPAAAEKQTAEQTPAPKEEVEEEEDPKKPKGGNSGTYVVVAAVVMLCCCIGMVAVMATSPPPNQFTP